MKSTFFRLAKFDPFQGIAIGVAAAEEPDRDREVLDYFASKPYFQRWSAEVQKDSQGKNFGPIRFQHDDKRPVGRIIEPLVFDDAKKQILITAKIEEPIAREMLASGTLTGFSIVGSYVSKTPRPDGLTSYIANPQEISVCDRPCVPSATFAVVKRDGSLQHRRFARLIKGGKLSSLDPTLHLKSPVSVPTPHYHRVNPNQARLLAENAAFEIMGLASKR